MVCVSESFCTPCGAHITFFVLVCFFILFLFCICDFMGILYISFREFGWP